MSSELVLLVRLPGNQVPGGILCHEGHNRNSAPNVSYVTSVANKNSTIRGLDVVMAVWTDCRDFKKFP